MKTHRARARDLCERREVIAKIMKNVASGDGAAIGRLHEVAARPLRFIVRSCWRDMTGRAPRADDEESMVNGCVALLVELAPSWRPDGGALPWNWAYPAIRVLVAQEVGVLGDEIDDFVLDASEPRQLGAHLDGSDAILLLRSHSDPRLRLLAKALTVVAKPRDAEIWLEYNGELGFRNRSPAVTLATNYGLKPTTVRKIAQRVGERLARLAADDHRFDSVLDLPAVRRHRRTVST